MWDTGVITGITVPFIYKTDYCLSMGGIGRKTWISVTILIVVTWYYMCDGKAVPSLPVIKPQIDWYQILKLPKCPPSMIDKYTKDFHCADPIDVSYEFFRNSKAKRCLCPDKGKCYASVGDEEVEMPVIKDYEFKCISYELYMEIKRNDSQFTEGPKK